MRNPQKFHKFRQKNKGKSLFFQNQYNYQKAQRSLTQISRWSRDKTKEFLLQVKVMRLFKAAQWTIIEVKELESSFRFQVNLIFGVKQRKNKMARKAAKRDKDFVPKGVATFFKKWTHEENVAYAKYLLNNFNSWNSNERLDSKFFVNMAQGLDNNRNNVQCRSHHQKMLKKYKTVQKLISSILHSQNDQENYEQTQDLELGQKEILEVQANKMMSQQSQQLCRVPAIQPLLETPTYEDLLHNNKDCQSWDFMSFFSF